MIRKAFAPNFWRAENYNDRLGRRPTVHNGFWKDDWFQRCVSYASRAYDLQNRRGEDYDVPPVYLIGLMDIEVGHPDKDFWNDRFVSEYTFREKESHDLLAETIVIIFVEMAHFNKRIEDCVTDLDKMLYLLKFIGKMMEQPAWLQNEVYTRIFNACEIAGFPEDKRIKYEQEMNDEKRLRSEYNTAKRMGLEEGLMKGREEGQQSKAIEIALKLMANGMSPSEAAEFVGISEDLLPQ